MKRFSVEILPNSGTKSQKLFKSLFSIKETKYNECTNDKKEQNLQTSENIHPDDRPGSKNNSDTSNSGNIKHIIETKDVREDTEPNNTTSLNEPNETTDNIFPNSNHDGPMEKNPKDATENQQHKIDNISRNIQHSHHQNKK